MSMRLDQELVHRGLCGTRTEAQELISAGAVLVNASVCTKQIRKILPADSLEVTSHRQFVSRGGLKLQGVLLDVFGTEEKIRRTFSGARALDVGSSTGGFTDCLLSYGAARVDAVDVGTAQLHAKLRSDNRVSVLENTDIRNFRSESAYDVIVADLSFIPLGNVLDDIVRLGGQGAHYFLLIKPQFEVGKGHTKKGIVKDEELVEEILVRYKMLAKEKGFAEALMFPCRLAGGDGNQEYFLYGKSQGKL